MLFFADDAGDCRYYYYGRSDNLLRNSCRLIVYAASTPFAVSDAPSATSHSAVEAPGDDADACMPADVIGTGHPQAVSLVRLQELEADSTPAKPPGAQPRRLPTTAPRINTDVGHRWGRRLPICSFSPRRISTDFTPPGYVAAALFHVRDDLFGATGELSRRASAAIISHRRRRRRQRDFAADFGSASPASSLFLRHAVRESCLPYFDA